MARKSTSTSIWRVCHPSYYLRRPRRLGFLFLFVVMVAVVGLDRHSQWRELEQLAIKLKEAEAEKSSLSDEVQQLRRTESVVGLEELQNQGKREMKETKVEPLILGVGVNTARGGFAAKKVSGGKGGLKVDLRGGSKHDGKDGHAEKERSKPRKVLPDKRKSSSFSKDSNEAANKKDSVERLMHVNDPMEDIQKLEVEEKKMGGKIIGVVEKLVNKTRVKETNKKGKKAAAHPQDPEEAKALQRREAVRWAMVHAWGAYEQYAWGYDELQPQSKRGVNHFGGLGATVVDSLGTLWIMGLKEQFDKARSWMAKVDFNKNYDASVFETTIRVLGGLISAYDLSGDKMFLKKAQELADRLEPAYNTPTGIPWNTLNLASGNGYSAGWTGGASVLADIGTQSMEYIALSQRTGNPKYAAKVEKLAKLLDKITPEDGLLPLFISPDTGEATSSKVSMGAMGDSYYEYLLKVWVMGGKTKAVERYRQLWDKAMAGMMKLVYKTEPSGFTYVAERQGDTPIHKMDHLACFAGGMLVLGAEGPHAKEYLDLGKELGRTCYEFYDRMPSKLSGEHYLFRNGQDLTVGHAYNIGRPETVETLMYLWRKTKDPKYREWGWNIFQAFEKHCRLPSGYTGLVDVSQNPPQKDDMMQSFFLAETLKYLYLLFSPDDVIPLDEWVFNTEAHPIRITSRAGEENPKAPKVDEDDKSKAAKTKAAINQGGESTNILGAKQNPVGENVKEVERS